MKHEHENTKTESISTSKINSSAPAASPEGQTEHNAGVTIGLPTATSERGGKCVLGDSGQVRQFDTNTPQPMPTPNTHPAVWDLVMADMAERDQIGAQKYGTRLQPHNGRDFLIKRDVDVEVPAEVLAALDDAIATEYLTDSAGRIVGERNVPRFPYQVK